jgi:diguanylate cyclase (GGDEF)-like protein
MTIDNYADTDDDDDVSIKFMDADGFVIVNRTASKAEASKSPDKAKFVTDYEVPQKDIAAVSHKPGIKTVYPDAQPSTSTTASTSTFTIPANDVENVISKTEQIEDIFTSSEADVPKQEAAETIFDTQSVEPQIAKKDDEPVKPKETILADEIPQDTSESNDRRYVDVPVNLVAELDKELNNSMEEFAYLITRFLVIIKSVLSADVVSFVWVNYSDKTLRFDSFLSDKNVNEAIIKDASIPFGDDIITQIVETNKPQILAQIRQSAEIELLPYYTEPVGTSSFVGIPVVLDEAVVGVLCASTKERDAYDRATVIFLGHFAKLVSILLTSYSDNDSNENATKTLELLNSFSEFVSSGNGTFKDISLAGVDFVAGLYNCTSIGTVMYDDKDDSWRLNTYKSVVDATQDFVSTPISLTNSLVGISISQNRPIVVSDVPTAYTRANEYEPSLNGSFISIPIRSTSDTYGALFIEADSDYDLAGSVDVDILQVICGSMGEMLEKIQLLDVFKDMVSIEVRTGIMTERAFRERLSEEIMRANDTKQNVTLSLISLDKYESIEDDSKKSAVFEQIIANIRAELKSFEFIGRVNSDVIGVVLIGRDGLQAKLLLERIRQHIATQFFEIDGNKLVITISAGIATNKPQDTFDKWTSNATAALRHAQQRSNCVHLFD